MILLDRNNEELEVVSQHLVPHRLETVYNIEVDGFGVCQHSCHPYLNQATKTSLALTRLDRRTGLRAVG